MASSRAHPAGRLQALWQEYQTRFKSARSSALTQIHADQIERYGGLAGIRDVSLLNSAVAMPRSGAARAHFHSDLFEMAAAYLFHIVKNHPFADGNKRVGAVAALVFLDMNGIDVDIHDDELFDIVIGVADGATPKSAVAEFLRRHRTN